MEPYLSGSEASRQWMTQRQRWWPQQGIASGAEFSSELWLSHHCTAAAPQCIPDAEATWRCHAFKQGEDQQWCRTVERVGCTEYKERASKRVHHIINLINLN